MIRSIGRVIGRVIGLGGPLVLLLGASACSTRVSSSAPPNLPAEAANLPRPARVLVADFLVDPSAVRQDQAIGLRLQRSMAGGSPVAARTALAVEVQSAISDTLVEGLDRAGLPAEHAPPDGVYRPGDMIVTGRVLRIDEGNRMRRLSIGFGAGKSVVEVKAELSAVMSGGQPVLLQTYDGTADSGRKPGMAVGASMAVANSSAGMGALSAVTNISGEKRRTPVGKEAASVGGRLAREIGEFAAGRGWIAEASVPAWTR